MTALEKDPSQGVVNPVSNISGNRPGGNLEFTAIDVKSENLNEVQNDVLPLYQSNLRKNGFNAVDRVRQKIVPGKKVRFAINPNTGRKVAFTSYSLRDVRGMFVASIDTTIVDERYQNRGTATRFAKDMIEEDLPEAVTGRNAEPWPLRAKIRTGYVERVYPNHSSFPINVQRALIEIIGPDIFDEEQRLKMNLNTGLWKNAYPFEHNRALDIDPDKHPEAYEIYATWRSPRIGMIPERNDAVQYWAKIDKGLVLDHLRTLTFPRELVSR